jgi:hypothetical protein
VQPSPSFAATAAVARAWFDCTLSVVPDIPAPPRFLPPLDNALRSHADRSRILPATYRKRVLHQRYAKGTVLVDGFVAAFWSVQRQPGEAMLRIKLFEPLSKNDRVAVTDEGAWLLVFVAADAESREVEIVDPT